MIAMYDGGKRLNVRSEPRPDAPVVRTMAPGEQSRCESVSHGWASLGDGFASAAYLVVADGGEALREPDATGEPAAPEVAESPALEAMTVPELRALAEQSGVKVRSKATKPELIAAILSDD